MHIESNLLQPVAVLINVAAGAQRCLVQTCRNLGFKAEECICATTGDTKMLILMIYSSETRASMHRVQEAKLECIIDD